jgi:hypothetical protein
MSVVVVISQHLLNVFVQLANKRGFKKTKKKISIATCGSVAIEMCSQSRSVVTV